MNSRLPKWLQNLALATLCVSLTMFCIVGPIAEWADTSTPKAPTTTTLARPYTSPYTSADCPGPDKISYIPLGKEPKVINPGAKCSLTEQVVAGRAVLLDWQDQTVLEDFLGKLPGGIITGQAISAKAVGSGPATIKVMLCMPNSPVRNWSCS